jgi:hypothetical protein
MAVDLSQRLLLLALRAVPRHLRQELVQEHGDDDVDENCDNDVDQ